MSSKAALLWDESYLWGIMSFKAFRGLGLGFELVNSEDIRSGRLEEFKAIYVPGGWASNKLEALGAEGADRIREFVSNGGSYISICGGAGLATSEGLGLLQIKRKPLKERVPSVSGKVKVNLRSHPIWEEIEDPVFTLWWPSQFVIGDDVAAIASFGEATAEAFSSDLNVGDMKAVGWEEAESAYGLNLDPAKMAGDPIVVEGTYGRGRVIASLIHFDSPGCRNGARVLENIWEHLGLERTKAIKEVLTEPKGAVYEIARELHDFGERNFLWFERGPLIQWRRGIRGFEYFTLYTLVKELSAWGMEAQAEGYAELKNMLGEFSARARRLLLLERWAFQKGEAITFSNARDEEIRSLRSELFGSRKSYGGFFKELLARADKLLYEKLKGGTKLMDKRGAGDEGLIHVYTGEGKGKTTASVGLALRAASRGLRVLFAQFMKERCGGEIEALERAGVDTMVFDKVLSPRFHPEVRPEELYAEARRAFETLSPVLKNYDLAVLDEFVTMISRGVVPEEEATEFVKNKPAGVELVLTGRGAGKHVIESADLVTKMDCLKHYYQNDVRARPGIEY